jgi:Holliday junction resolvasome RuvABC endonuclease subunit
MRKFVIGVDAGFAATGMIILEMMEDGELEYVSCYTVRTEKSSTKRNMRMADDDVMRVLLIIDTITSYFNGHIPEGSSVFASVELPTGGSQGARANRTMGMATGALATLFRVFQNERDWIVEYITPIDVKMAAVGSKSASKDEMMDWFRDLMKDTTDEIESLPKVVLEHIADAYGAVCHSWANSDLYTTFKRI